MDPALRIQPGQEALTPKQEAEVRRFAQARIAAQLATSPVDELETERLLRQAYAVAQLPPPQHIVWLDGPLQLVAVRDRSMGASVEYSLWTSVWQSVVARVRQSVGASVTRSVGYSVYNSVWDSVRDSVYNGVWDGVRDSVGASPWIRDRRGVGASEADRLWGTVGEAGMQDSMQAYVDAPWLTVYRFFDEYLAPNAAHALAHFNERVSGCWLGEDTALLIRRPTLLARDQAGRLHSARGKCLAYPDGWGFYAWHGVRVPEQVILAPETLTREDFLNERDVEVRRVIQERMGSRFVSELGGRVIDSSPRGTLYEVRLPDDDPEQVARYVQVQDVSTPRQYFLRVPPTIQTAAEAVAWSFGLSGEEYAPQQET